MSDVLNVYNRYLAADTQLYIVGLVVYLLGRNLVVRKKLLVGLFLLGLVLPALHTYFQDLEGNLLITPMLVFNRLNFTMTTVLQLLFNGFVFDTLFLHS